MAKKSGNITVDSAGSGNPGDAEESLGIDGSDGGGGAAIPSANTRYI